MSVMKVTRLLLDCRTAHFKTIYCASPTVEHDKSTHKLSLLPGWSNNHKRSMLGGSWVVISSGRELVTPLIATHEPPSTSDHNNAAAAPSLTTGAAFEVARTQKAISVSSISGSTKQQQPQQWHVDMQSRTVRRKNSNIKDKQA